MSGPTVSLAEAARRLGVSTTTVRRWLDDGRLPGTVRGPDGYAIPEAEVAVEVAMLDVEPPPRTVEPDPTTTPSEPRPLDLAAVVADLASSRQRELDAALATIDDLRRERDALLDDLRRERERSNADTQQLLAAIAELMKRPTIGAGPIVEVTTADAPPANSWPSTGSEKSSSPRRWWHRK